MGPTSEKAFPISKEGRLEGKLFTTLEKEASEGQRLSAQGHRKPPHCLGGVALFMSFSRTSEKRVFKNLLPLSGIHIYQSDLPRIERGGTRAGKKKKSEMQRTMRRASSLGRVARKRKKKAGAKGERLYSTKKANALKGDTFFPS